jgi:cyclin-dependent kinase 2
MITTYHEFPHNRFQKKHTLGQGSYGKVFLAKDTMYNTDVAIKKSKIPLDYDGIPPSYLREIVILRELDHPNIVKLLEVVLTDNELYLVFEYVETDLKQMLLDDPEYFTLENVKSII